jgi:magnesium transporter
VGVELPTPEEAQKNEALGRMYREDGVSFMAASVISKAAGPYPETQTIAFIVTERLMVSIRSIVPTSFHKFADRLRQHPRDFASGPEVLEGLLEEMALRVSRNSDLVVAELDELSHQIFDPYGLQEDQGKSTSDRMKEVLRRLGAVGDLNGKISESLYSFIRLVAFFKESQSDNLYLVRKLEALSGDIKELLRQTDFVSDKITFQLDATLGMINVEQNQIMRIISVFTVMIMPPTLIGGIYGMNFKFMPELDVVWGYPLALVTMLLCATGPYFYFRRKGWL